MKRNISETSKGGDLVWGRGWKKRSSTEKSNEFCPFCFRSRLFCSLGRFDWHNVFCSTLQNIVADNRYSCFLHSSLCSAQFVNLCNFEIKFPFRILYAMDADRCYINKLENVLKGIKTVYKTPAVLSSSVVYAKMHLGAWLSGRNTHYWGDRFMGAIMNCVYWAGVRVLPYWPDYSRWPP